jgi:hypothetical protein
MSGIMYANFLQSAVKYVVYSRNKKTKGKVPLRLAKVELVDDEQAGCTQ